MKNSNPVPGKASISRRLIMRAVFCGGLAFMLPLSLLGQTAPNVDAWVDACNVTWTTPGPTSAQSMPIGNGDIGLNTWIETNGSLDFYISKTDAWSEDCSATANNWGPSALLKLAGMHISMSPNPLGTGAAFSQVLMLRTGQIQIKEGGTTILVWVDANNPVARVEVTSATPTTVTVSLNDWRTTLQGSITPDTILANQTNQIVWYHQNAASADSHVAKLVFGAAIKGAGMVSTNSTTLHSSTAGTYQLISVYPLTASSVATTPSQWLTQLDQKMSAIDALNLATTRTAHQTWWENFWHRSWVFVRGDSNATAVTEGYVLQRFVTACGGRGAYPIKFNGSIFVVDDPTQNPPVNADHRAWGGQHWFQNTRAMYWPRLMAGDFDIMMPLFNMDFNMLAANEAQVTSYYGSGQGGYFAETAPWWGGLSNASPSQPGNYTLHYFTPILEQCMMMLDYYDYTGNTTFAQQTLVPVATAGLQFFSNHFGRDANGKILLNPDNAIEMYWKVNDPAPDIAGLQAILPRLIALPGNIVPASTHDTWVTLLGQLPPLPVGTKNGSTVLLPYTGAQTAPSHNSENPELYSIYPFRLYGLGKANYGLALDTFNARSVKQTGGWPQDPIQAAMLGLSDLAKSDVITNFTDKDPRQKFPAFWASLQDYTPNQCNGGNGENALQQMIMQVDGRTIYLAPAWPKGWDCDFKLNAPYQTTVQGSIVGGKVTSLVVTPSSRAADIIDMSSLSPDYLGGYDILYKQDLIAALKATTPGNTNVLAVSGTDYSTSEGPANALDWNLGTKYYNKAQDGANPPGVHTGIVVTPKLGSSVVTAVLLATANDAPNRDPRTITIEGSNAIGADQAGGGGFSLIYSGTAGLLPNLDRNTWGLYSSFPNTTAYKTYRILVSSTAGGSNSDGTQFSEVELSGTLAAPLAGSNILSASDATAALKQTSQGGTNVLAVSGTDYSSTESAANVKDNNLNTKYYNSGQGGINTGFVITPAAGAKVINGFQIATANDVPARDPVSITIEGSNAANAGQAGGGGFTLLYSGPSGLQTGLARQTWGPVINFWNTTAYATYRILVTNVANGSGGGAQYSEVHLLTPIPVGQNVSFQANDNMLWVCADNAGASPLIANRGTPQSWETFKVIDLSSQYGPCYVALQSQANNLYVTAANNGVSPLIANSNTIGPWQAFYWKDYGNGSLSLQCKGDNLWVCADNNGASPLIANRANPSSWETFYLKVWP